MQGMINEMSSEFDAGLTIRDRAFIVATATIVASLVLALVL